MEKRARDWLLGVGSRLQPTWLSSRIHGSQYNALLSKLDDLPPESGEHHIRILLDPEYRREALNGPHMKLDRFIEEFPNRSVAIDLGSGCGWMAHYLSHYFDEVVAIEPSRSAINIAKRAFGSGARDNIRYVNSDALRGLGELNWEEPVFAVTGVVLSHLSDKSVKKICEELNAHWQSGSVGVFAEAWGEPRHQPMWHVRSRAWWESLFPLCAVDFFGIEADGRPREHLGLSVYRY